MLFRSWILNLIYRGRVSIKMICYLRRREFSSEDREIPEIEFSLSTFERAENFLSRDVSKTMFKQERWKKLLWKKFTKVWKERKILQKLANSFCGKCARNSISVVFYKLFFLLFSMNFYHRKLFFFDCTAIEFPSRCHNKIIQKALL